MEELNLMHMALAKDRYHKTRLREQRFDYEFEKLNALSKVPYLKADLRS